MDLLVEIHSLCKRLPTEEKYELTSQMRRASKSIPANIAEGFGKRASAKEFKQYMRMAMASANEMETHLRIAGRLGYVPSEELDGVVDGYNHVGRQLNRLISVWKAL
jgi:four helix bundle protein